MKISREELEFKKSLSLEEKILLSRDRIRDWHDHYKGKVSVSFSGGKDSTVLLHLVRTFYPEVTACFVDTGLEYPEIRNFVKETPNVVWIKPKMGFKEVIEKYGYPVVSKRIAQYIHELQVTKSENVRRLRLTGIRKDGTFFPMARISKKWQYLGGAPFKISDRCCNKLKKEPFDVTLKTVGYPFVGMMTGDSSQREQTYYRIGCNYFDSDRPRSTPMAFWTEKDVWEYLKQFNVPYSEIYNMGYTRTGCMFCMFGVHLEREPNRFQLMKQTHPSQYKYCMENLGIRKVLDYIHVPYDKDQMSLLEVKHP